MVAGRIYTVGHSKHEIGYFLSLLEAWSITCVVDVRSIAASRFNPQFNKKALAASLKDEGIEYLHMPDEFGARQTAPEVLTDGQVDFVKVRKSEQFRRGVERLKTGLRKGYNIALMCAESEPLECHRFSMISVDLNKKGLDVFHILKDRTIKSNRELEEELLTKYKKKILTSSLFPGAISYEERLDASYRLQNQEIGFIASR